MKYPTSYYSSTDNLWRHLKSKHINSYESTNFAKRKRQKFTNFSEIWKHFHQQNIDNVEWNICNHCADKYVSNSGSTGTLWDHLKRKHTKIYELTNYAKDRKQKSEQNLERNSNSSSEAHRQMTKRSEIWNHFTEKKMDDVKWTNCNYCTNYPKLNSSTGILWDHLKSNHTKIYELTNYAKNRKRKREQKLKRNSKEAYRTTKTSEIWNHFTQKKIDDVKWNNCNYCTNYQMLNSSTSILWTHLKNSHTKIYESTNYAKTNERKRKQNQSLEFPTENEAKRNSNNSSEAHRQMTRKSEIWNHFHQQNVDNVEWKVCNHCKNELPPSKYGSTSILWRHLKNNHKKIYELTNYAKNKESKRKQNIKPTELSEAHQMSKLKKHKKQFEEN